jgi:methyltransferase (TIGR00027 family)
VVILGSGWDTRAYGLLASQEVTIFEVDAPATQAVKRAAIDKTGLDASHVTYVSCDFNRQSWLDAVKEHGFGPEKRAFILWEGVTMYLDEHAIQSTLRAVSILPAGSRIAFDFMSREWLEGTLAGKMARWSVQATYGEPFTFGFPIMPDFSSRLSGYLEKQGLALERDRPMGDEGEGGLPFGGLALAVKPA